MLLKIGINVNVVSTPKDLMLSKKIIIPGVGAFDNGMSALKKLDLIDSIKALAESNVPILGICLGMQLLGTKSEEGKQNGLGLIPGISKKFKFYEVANKNFKIPHMGWNKISPTVVNPLLLNLENQNRFYFVHSYHFVPDINENILATTNYGYNFCSIINSNNIYGTQFHPEKSHKYGIILLKNFADI